MAMLQNAILATEFNMQVYLGAAIFKATRAQSFLKSWKCVNC